MARSSSTGNLIAAIAVVVAVPAALVALQQLNADDASETDVSTTETQVPNAEQAVADASVTASGPQTTTTTEPIATATDEPAEGYARASVEMEAYTDWTVEIPGGWTAVAERLPDRRLDELALLVAAPGSSVQDTFSTFDAPGFIVFAVPVENGTTQSPEASLRENGFAGIANLCLPPESYDFRSNGQVTGIWGIYSDCDYRGIEILIGSFSHPDVDISLVVISKAFTEQQLAHEEQLLDTLAFRWN